MLEVHNNLPVVTDSTIKLFLFVSGTPQIPSARGTKSACGRRASAVGMLFYEIVETAQAILINYILIDGSAQTVSYIVGVISTWIKNLR